MISRFSFSANKLYVSFAGADLWKRCFSGKKTDDPSRIKFSPKLTSGWKDLIASLSVLGLGGTRFFWWAFLGDGNHFMRWMWLCSLCFHVLNFGLHIHFNFVFGYALYDIILCSNIRRWSYMILRDEWNVQDCVSEIMKRARQSNVPIVVDGVRDRNGTWFGIFAWLALFLCPNKFGIFLDWAN